MKCFCCDNWNLHQAVKNSLISGSGYIEIIDEDIPFFSFIEQKIDYLRLLKTIDGFSKKVIKMEFL
jgi:hypothetical protein